MSNLYLPPNPTLAQYQQYVRDLVIERGFNTSTPESFQMLMEECGELAKAARKQTKMKTDVSSTAEQNTAFEAADVFIFLLDICNQLGVDLEQAFRAKEEINKTRTWK